MLLWPLNIEAVRWIASASTLLTVCFSLGTLHLWLSFQDSRKITYYLFSLICFALALGSKAEAALLPAILCFLIVVKSNDRAALKKSAVAFVPFIVLTLGFLVLESMSYRAMVAYITHYLPGAVDELPVTDLSLPARLDVLVQFLGQLFAFRGWPFLLAAIGITFLRADKEAKQLFSAFVISALLCSAALAFATGEYSLYERFHYVPICFLACGTAILMSRATVCNLSVFMASATLTWGTIGLYELTTVTRIGAPLDLLLFGVLLMLVFGALRKHEPECIKVSRLLIPAAFASFGYTETAPAWAFAVICAVGISRVVLKSDNAQTSFRENMSTLTRDVV
jgi:hypothetical protein